MRQLGVHLTSGVLLTMLVAGCDRDIEPPVSKPSAASHGPPSAPFPEKGRLRVTATAPAGARHPSPSKGSNPIVVRAKYHAARGPCIHLADVSWAMPVMDSFKVVKVLRGRLKAEIIDVRPLTPRDRSYPGGMAEGAALTLRLNLSDESARQAVENERNDNPWLIVNGDEVEQIAEP